MTFDPSSLFAVPEPAPLTVRDRMHAELRTEMDNELRALIADSHTSPEDVETARQDPKAVHPDAAEELTSPPLPPSAKHDPERVDAFGEPSTMFQPSTATLGSRGRGQRPDNANLVNRRNRRKPYARKTLAQPKVVKVSHARHDSMPPLVESDEIEDDTSEDATEGGSGPEIGERSD